MMNEVARRNDFAVIGAEFRASAQRPGAGLRDHGTDTRDVINDSRLQKRAMAASTL